MSAYKATLSRPLKIGFGLDLSGPPFGDFIRALYNIRPAKPTHSISWSLDKVLGLALSDQFQNNPSSTNLMYISLFLLSLATGGRISELFALLRGDEFLKFSDLGVTLFPNPNFLAKNEDPGNRRDPIFITRLMDEKREPHPLCPVNNLFKYVLATSATKSFKLFVNPIDFSDVSINKLRLYLCKLVRCANPGSFPKPHDLRKYASSFAFFKSMSCKQICDQVGWSSINVFKKHYLKEISEISSSVVMLGSIIPGTNNT